MGTPDDNRSPEPDGPLFPVVGDIVEPTPEAIAQGRFGNGSWTLTDTSIEQAQQAVHEAKQERKDERERFFHEEAKDALRESIEYHRRIVRMGDAVLDKIEAGDSPSRAEMSVLSQAQKSAVELVNRGIGKPKQMSEHKEEKSILSVLLVKDETSD